MKCTFHHVHLLCSDLETTISFFRDKLSATLVKYAKFGPADGATLDLNGTRVNLRVANNAETVVGDSSMLTYGYHHICVQTDDIDRGFEELSEQGVEFIAEPMETPDARIAFCKGPDNIVIEILQPLES